MLKHLILTLRFAQAATRKNLVALLLVGLSQGFTTWTLAQTSITVGTQTIEIQDTQRSRNLTSEVWFPASSEALASPFSPLLPIQSIDIALAAQPRTGLAKKPLIVMSYGNWGTRYSQGWLNIELVKAGFIVLSPSHPGTLNADQTVAGRIRLWDRARDVTVVLDQFLSDPKWAAMVDASRIGFIGHSFGGHTGVMLAGARFDLARQVQACQRASNKDLYCDGLLTEDYSKVPLTGMAENYKDERIKAFYIMASGPAQGFAPESLAQIRSPFFVDTARTDAVLEPVTNSSAFAKQLPGSKEVLRDVGHFSYVPLCKPFIGKVVAALICTDPNGVDRKATHELVARDATQFFIQNLAAPL